MYVIAILKERIDKYSDIFFAGKSMLSSGISYSYFLRTF